MEVLEFPLSYTEELEFPVTLFLLFEVGTHVPDHVSRLV
jgi:hypothetical protein